jgi:nitroreductase
MEFLEALSRRRAIPSFDPTVKISREELMEILDQANLAPSSMNLQHWEYIVCQTSESKAKLQEAAFNQKKISESSAAILLLGNRFANFQHSERVAEAMVQHGYYGEERREKWIEMAQSHWLTEQQKRDEAFRGSSLWAMVFMLAAQNAGWDTAPMGGYDPAKVMETFSIPEDYVPVLIICIGKANPDVNLLPRVPRISAAELAHFDAW